MSLSPIVIKTWKGKESLQSLSFFFLRHFFVGPPPTLRASCSQRRKSQTKEIFDRTAALTKKYQIRGPAGRRLFRISSFLSLYCISRVRTIRSLFFLLSFPPFLPSTFHFRFSSSNFSPCFLLSLPPVRFAPTHKMGKERERERERERKARSFVRSFGQEKQGQILTEALKTSLPSSRSLAPSLLLH